MVSCLDLTFEDQDLILLVVGCTLRAIMIGFLVEIIQITVQVED